MALYMVQGSYSPEAWAAMMKNPDDRKAAVSKLLAALGGRLIDFYFCFGEYDFVLYGELPDDVTSMTAVLAALAHGHLKTTKTTKLLTVEEAMQAMGQAGKIAFAAPKG